MSSYGKAVSEVQRGGIALLVASPRDAAGGGSLHKRCSPCTDAEIGGRSKATALVPLACSVLGAAAKGSMGEKQVV